MNQRVQAPSSVARGGEPSATAAARELRVAGEALIRAAAIIAAIEGRRSAHRSEQQQGSSVSLAEHRLSGRQLGAIRAASRRAGLSRGEVIELLEKVTGKSTASELSRSEASGVLDRLSAMTGYQR